MTVNQAYRPLLVMALCALALAACAEPADRDAEAASQAGEVFELRFLSPAAGDGAVAARVGETVITIEDVRREAGARGLVEDVTLLHPAMPAFRQVLSELIDQRLLALEAAGRNLQDDAEARRRLSAAEERILGNVLVETAISDAVSDEAVRRVYEEQASLAPQAVELRARHILVDTREEADEVARLVAEGADFAQLAARVSRDPATRFDGGDLGYFTREGILGAFAQVAFSTGPGQVSPPFQTEYGWHVLTVTDRRSQPRASLEEKRADIVRFLTLQGIDGLLADIRETYPVTVLAGAAPEGLRASDADPQAPAPDAPAPDAPASETDSDAAPQPEPPGDLER